MRNFKGVNFGSLLSSQKEAEELLPDLKEFLSKPPAGLPSCRYDAERRQTCDAILRACNQQLTAKLPCPGHLGSLLELAELACHGYLVSTPQRSPLYLERILFIFLRNVASQGSPEATLRLAQPLHTCLVQCSHQVASQDYEAVARGSFSLLWKGAEALVERHAALSARLKALSFLVLLEDESTSCEVPHFASPTACRVVAAHQLFDSSGPGLSEADADFLDDLLSKHVIRVLVGEGGSSPGPLSPQRALCFLELILEHCRRLCWSRHHTKATQAVEKAHGYLKNTDLALSLQLCQLGVELFQVREGGGPQTVAKLLVKASAVVKASMEAPSPPLRALCESCQFFLSGLERGTKGRYGSDAVLGLSAFLCSYCSLIRQLRDGVFADSPKQQQSLVQMQFQGLHLYTLVVYDFAQGCQEADLTDLAQLVESCKSTVVWMLEALEGLSGPELTDYLGMTASYTSNLAYNFYSHKLYAEACAISDPFCQHLGLAKPNTYPEVPPEKLHRCFRLHVESLKKLGKQAQGCNMVTLWLAALRPCGTKHMTEPVNFWVRVKMDAARAGDKEIQLKTLRDSLSGWDLDTLGFLLREELRAYKAVRADTGQERFNVICDLLELSPEDTPTGTWARATHLVELAQVLCYHDFAQQTDCSALDAIREALQLLESVRPESQAEDQLLDDKAQALLWLYICTLEAKMQEGIERDRRAQAPCNLEEFEVNDLNYEDRLQEDRFLYSNIAFNLAADAARSKCLDQALVLWKKVLTRGQAPAVRCLQQTAASLQILATLYQLLAKPLQALEVFLLLRTASKRLEDPAKAAGSSCHITQLLLSLGCPSYAQLFLTEAESSLKLLDDHTSDTYLLLAMTCDLLRSKLYCTTQKVTEGVSLLLSVLRDPALQKSSKAWYLLRVQALQLVAVYLSLSSTSLPLSLGEQLCAQGWQTPEVALIDSHKLLRSIILLLMGSDVLSVQKVAVETPFLDYGENLVQKWQVLSEVLSCSEKLVSRLGLLGSVSEAKAFCLEALKLTMKLQIPHQCALFLVLKGELELARSDLDLCQSDLQQVLFLMESCTEFCGLAQHPDSVKKVHPQKGKRQARVRCPPELPEEELFLRGPALELVATVAKEPGPTPPSTVSSPILKAKPQLSPSFLSHSPTCDCSLCTSPVLSAVCLRWALVTAGLKLAMGHQTQGLDLLQAVLKGCPAASKRLAQALQTSLNHRLVPSPVPSFLDEILAQAYTQLALEGLSQPSDKSLGKVLESGLKFVAARIPFLEPWRASLLLTQALIKLVGLKCCPTQLFANSWDWQPVVVKNPPASEISKTRNNKHLGAGHQQMTSATLPYHNTSLKGLEGGPPCTPMPRGRVRQAGPRIPFTVFEEDFSTKSKPEVPKAPRVQQKVQTRLKVNFSDDSDLEDPVSAEANFSKEPKRRSCASRGRGRTRKGLKTNAVVAPDGALEHPGLSGRNRRAKKVVSGPCEARGPEIMRTIPEEELADSLMEMSFEILRGSDGEDSATGGDSEKVMFSPAPGPEATIGECEVLRRDFSKEELPTPCPDKERSSYFSPGLQLPSTPVAIGLSTLDSICDSLSLAFCGISHCPPSGLYAHLCRLLALCLGHRDPYATAFLVTESVSITCRHQLLTHLHRQLSKAQKHRGALEVAEQLQHLSLQEKAGDVPLARIQHLFSFRASGSGHFPQPEKESFKERLALIPSGVTVCVLALVTLQPGTVGNILLLTRLEKDTPPVTVQIPTAQSKLPLSSALKEFDDIQKAQKENSSCTDKREWWKGRLELDHRMEVLITSLEKYVLGCWRGLLLPSGEDPGPAQEASRLQELLQECGWKYPNPTLLKILLSGANALTSQDIQTLAYGLCPAQPERARELLSEAVGRLQGLTVPIDSSRHLVLVLDKDLQKLPWESMPSLRALPLTRLPSFRFLLTYSIAKESGASSVLSQGVDPHSTFYVLNPHNNLSSTEQQFRGTFSSEAGWRGVVGEVPSPEQVQAALTEHDLYIYAGHGAGARFLDGQAVLRLSCRAVALLFGCSSAALAVHGNLEGAGIVLKYIMAGCPLFLGNLWDVTDRDIDRYTSALLQGWLGAGPGAPLLYYVNQARQAPRLKYLIGAAPVAYGLPVSLR
ncbi:PREDICTED: separin [Chrysochloris asiatica]|uniref:separase n=1 Tax=Chrysochloris asiatica TaxID=185453 RepID=A0A9B0WWN8_CHRAS|nr:PREDICTED: separin [Chrysochloris asiatica]